MGLFGGSTTTTSNEKFDTGPSSFQRPYLDQTFGAAQGIYNNTKDSPYYQGKTYAGMSGDAQDALKRLKDFAGGTGMNTATTLSNIGSNLAGYAGQAGGLIDRFVGMAGEDATKANMDAAARYADNPYIQGQIDANARDVTRNLTEDILPGIDRNASAGGNINSSRAGIASGIAQRGAADRISDISAQIRGDAWNRGLSMAQTDRQNNMQALQSGAQAYSSLGQVGMDAMSQGAQAGYGAFDRINSANLLDQQDRQGQLDADFASWQGNDQRQWDLLNRYNSIVAGNQWGQSGTSSSKSVQKTSGGILGQIAGLASTAAAFIPSDARLKRNVEKIGEREDGLGVYRYDYVWDPEGTGTVGVMADEVALKRPEALGPIVGDYLTVDYSKL